MDVGGEVNTGARGLSAGAVLVVELLGVDAGAVFVLDGWLGGTWWSVPVAGEFPQILEW